MTLLSRLIKSPPPSVDSQSKAADTATAQSAGVSRLVKIERAGDVLHVFSHIRKTYRLQWVVLEGGGPNPPELARRPPVASSSTKKTKVTMAKLESMWIPLDDVEKAK